MITTTSRKTARKSVATSMQTPMLAAGAVAVYDHQRSILPEAMPFVRILSSGSGRSADETNSYNYEGTIYYYVVEIWVMHANAKRTVQEAAAEDLLDDLEQAFATWLDSVQNGSLAVAIDYIDRTSVERIDVAGSAYLVESILIRVVL